MTFPPRPHRKQNGLNQTEAIAHFIRWQQQNQPNSGAKKTTIKSAYKKKKCQRDVKKNSKSKNNRMRLKQWE